MNAAIAVAVETVAAAFGLAMDLLAALGQCSPADLETAKQLCIARLQNYATSEAVQRAKEWRIAAGIEPDAAVAFICDTTSLGGK